MYAWGVSGTSLKEVKAEKASANMMSDTLMPSFVSSVFQDSSFDSNQPKAGIGNIFYFHKLFYVSVEPFNMGINL